MTHFSGNRGAFFLFSRDLKYENLVFAGIVDLTKVVCSALQNATSIAELMLTTEAMIAELPKKEDTGAAGGHPHMHGGGMGMM